MGGGGGSVCTFYLNLVEEAIHFEDFYLTAELTSC